MPEGSAAGGYIATDIFRKTILNTQKLVFHARGGTTDEETVPLTEEATLQDTSFGEDVTGQKVVRSTMVFTYPDGMLDNAACACSDYDPCCADRCDRLKDTCSRQHV